ncbi:Uncharacterised protein [uncultured Roseburia sp.]|uniref:C39 family peptidase n=1 Tax=Brotonthovivens ammoniilytica TaxID=2981725 RepID=A0ABT2TGE4_9FIRM|nr:papain-like cysteine protease family protein [Brotonthovivens ammoniilytica]MCU6761259.1 C39 family peptidase [Brotonthovivens ammoniilytica]SCI23539.1 Uncharacterised protein [uncultured Roseburia sp.]
MKKTLARMLSIVLSSVMLYGMLGVSVSAQDINNNQFKLNIQTSVKYTAKSVVPKDQSEIRRLNDEIVDFVSAVFEVENINVNVKEDIRFLDIIKCYNDTDILQLNIYDETDILEELDSGNYAYYVYVDVAGYKVEIILSKGSPVTEEAKKVFTEEQLRSSLDDVGRWTVSGAGIIQNDNICLDDFISKFEGEYDNIILASSQKGFEYPVIVAIQDEEAKDIIPVYEEQAYEATNILKEEEGIYSFSEAVMLSLNPQYDNIFIEAENSESIIDSATLEEATLSSSSGYTKQLGVTRQKQEDTKWCWAASASMIGKYISSPGKTQTAIVKYVKGSKVNEGATTSETKKAVQYAVGSNHKVKTYNIVPMTTFIKYIYSMKHPIAMELDWDSGNGHVVVIAGVKSSNNLLYVIDPWKSVTNRWLNYNSMCNGTVFGSGTGRYDKIHVVD